MSPPPRRCPHNPDDYLREHNPLYEFDAGGKISSAKFHHKKREEISSTIAHLLANPDTSLPTEEPFVPKGTVVERTDDELSQHEAMRAFGKIGEEALKSMLHEEDLARKIALDAEFMEIISKTKIIQILNSIIKVNNVFWSDGDMQEQERISNFGINAAYTMLQEGKMPYFEENDIALMREGRINELSRKGKVTRMIYAKLLARILIQAQKGLTSGETHRYEGVRSQTVRLDATQLGSDLLTLPYRIHFGIDGVIRLEWKDRIKVFLKTHEVQLATKKEITETTTPLIT